VDAAFLPGAIAMPDGFVQQGHQNRLIAAAHHFDAIQKRRSSGRGALPAPNIVGQIIPDCRRMVARADHIRHPAVERHERYGPTQTFEVDGSRAVAAFVPTLRR
jgi:hypothetical protein